MSGDRKRLQREQKILMAKRASGALSPEEKLRLEWLEVQLSNASGPEPREKATSDPMATEDDAEIPRDDLDLPPSNENELLQALEDDVSEDDEDDLENYPTANYSPVSLQKNPPVPAHAALEGEAPKAPPAQEPAHPFKASSAPKTVQLPPPLPKKKTPIQAIPLLPETPSLPVLRDAAVPRRAGNEEDGGMDSGLGPPLEDLLSQDDYPDSATFESQPREEGSPVLRSATIHYLDGVTRRGQIADFDPQADLIRLIPQGGSADIVEEVSTDRLKTIFLMTLPEGSSPGRQGVGARVSLVDGRTLEGVVPDYDPETKAFMLYPKEERGNIGCIVVYRKAVTNIRLQDS